MMQCGRGRLPVAAGTRRGCVAFRVKYIAAVRVVMAMEALDESLHTGHQCSPIEKDLGSMAPANL